MAKRGWNERKEKKIEDGEYDNEKFDKPRVRGPSSSTLVISQTKTLKNKKKSDEDRPTNGPTNQRTDQLLVNSHFASRIMTGYRYLVYSRPFLCSTC